MSVAIHVAVVVQLLLTAYLVHRVVELRQGQLRVRDTTRRIETAVDPDGDSDLDLEQTAAELEAVLTQLADSRDDERAALSLLRDVVQITGLGFYATDREGGLLRTKFGAEQFWPEFADLPEGANMLAVSDSVPQRDPDTKEPFDSSSYRTALTEWAPFRGHIEAQRGDGTWDLLWVAHVPRSDGTLLTLWHDVPRRAVDA